MHTKIKQTSEAATVDVHRRGTRKTREAAREEDGESAQTIINFTSRELKRSPTRKEDVRKVPMRRAIYLSNTSSFWELGFSPLSSDKKLSYLCMGANLRTCIPLLQPWEAEEPCEFC
jgi:hypothetical protein